MTQTAVPAPSGLPSTIPLDGDWAFTYTHGLGTEPQPVPPAADAFSCRMPVPAYWDDHLDNLREAAFWSDARFNPAYRHIEVPLGQNPPDASLPYLLGVGWYRREFVAPPEGRVTLAVGGVALEAWVWLNGQFAGHHLGHSTPFEMSLDAPLRHGETNELVIAVANTRTYVDLYGLTDKRSVRLIRRLMHPRQHVYGVRLVAGERYLCVGLKDELLVYDTAEKTWDTPVRISFRRGPDAHGMPGMPGQDAPGWMALLPGTERLLVSGTSGRLSIVHLPFFRLKVPSSGDDE